MTKLALNNLTFDGGLISESHEGLKDQILDLVKTCKKNKIKVPVPEKPTSYSDVVRTLRDKKILASNDVSESEGEEEVNDLRAQHREEVKGRFIHTVL